MKITFSIPGQPQGKGRARAFTTPNGIRMHTPEKTIYYENLIKHCFLAETGGTCPRSSEQIYIKACNYHQIPRSKSKRFASDARKQEIRPTTKPDIENVSKAILDALNGIAYLDDSQVVSLSIKKFYDDNPRVEVTVSDEGEIE